jgi:pyridoxine kinase
MQGHELLDLVDGLKGNNLVDYDYLITGYIGSESFLQSVLDVLATIENVNPNVKYVCDPVLGDEGVCYVPAVLVDIYRERVIPRAYMITPNQFEAELLTGMKIIDEQSAITAMIHLFDLGPTVVVLSSAEFPDVNPGKLFCYTLMRDKKDPQKYHISRVIVNKMPGKYTGTGDCTTVLMLAWMHRTNQNTSRSLLNSISTVQGILTKTRERMLSSGVVAGIGAPAATSTMDEEAKLRKMKLMRYSELCIIPGKRYIEEPPIEELSMSVVEWCIEPNNADSYIFKE